MYQQANIKTYGSLDASGVTINFPDIPASGTVKVPDNMNVSGTWKQNVSYTSNTNTQETISPTYTGSSVSAGSLSKTPKARTQVGTISIEATGNDSKKWTGTRAIYQQANVKTYTQATVTQSTGVAPNTFPASSSSQNFQPSLKFNYNIGWTSGATETETGIVEPLSGLNWSVSPSGEGLSASKVNSTTF